jgi:hypothetical protein
LLELGLANPEIVRKFEFLREIASGGFGSVYLTKVMHPDGFSRIAAVKLLHRRWSENEEIARRMRDEARLLGWLRHRNIVDVVDLTSLDGRAAIIMEYLEAVDLKALVQALGHTENAMGPQVCLQVIAAVSSALDAAYNRPPFPGEKPLRVIHRDIKPSNIMIDDSGLVKVLDFGVARAEFDARESDTRELQFGSIDYMPPERLLFEPESPRSDVYSLGATLFEMITTEKLGKAKGSPIKHSAFLADRLSFLRATTSVTGPAATDLETMLVDCLAYEATDRPAAATLGVRCRELARQFDGPSLQEWSESNIPALLVIGAESGDKYNPMTGRVLTEDRISLGGDGQVVGREKPAVLIGQTETLPELEAAREEEESPPDGPPTLAELRSIEVTDLGGAVLGDGPGNEDLEEATRLDDPGDGKFGNDDATRIEPAQAAPEEDWEDAATRLEDPAELKARIMAEMGEDEPVPEATEAAEQETEPDFEGVDELPIMDTDKEVSGPHSVALSEVSVPRSLSTRPMGLDPSLPLAVPGTGSLGPGIVDGATLTEDADGAQGMGDGPTQMMPEDEILGLSPEPGGDDPTRLMPDGPGSPLDTAPALPTSAPHLASPPPRDVSSGGPGGLASAPPMPGATKGLGSETVFTSVGGDGLTDDGTDTTVVHRVAASFLVFGLALAVGLGAGSILFKEELFGESGVVTSLFAGGDDSTEVEESVMATPPPVELPPEEPVEENPLAGFNGTTVAFESLMEGTRRLTVSCEGGIRETGRTTVVLATPTVTKCVITALGEGGARKTVVVENIRAGLTQCFEGGKAACSS